MGADTKKKSSVPPLPASTETDSTVQSPTELATDLSKPGDDRSSYSLPDDGTPVTIKTRGHRPNKSQTSLLIEYFEGGKSSTSSEQRKPSVRVRVTPSSKKSRTGADRDHIQITETKTRKASLTRRAGASSSSAAGHGVSEGLSVISGDVDDANSYASATEESNVSRNPIDIEIDRSGNVRRRRPASPLIPAADSKMSFLPAAMSDVSAIPPDSFFDGSGPTTSFKMSDAKHGRSRSPSRIRDVLAGATAGLTAAAATKKLREKSQDRERERTVLPKTRDKDRKHKSSRSKSRTSSKDEKYVEENKSPRRSGSRGLLESAVSGVDSSASNATSHRSYDQHSVRSGASKTSSINNPKLLETVEDAIRRLILPELNALKREQSKHKERRSSTNSSATSISRDEYGSERRRSTGTDKNSATPRDSLKLKRRDREARHDFDDTSSQSVTHTDGTEDMHRVDPVRGHGHVGTAALGAGLGGAAALAAHELLQSPSDDKRSRRRRRAEMRSRGSSEQSADLDESPLPPMPLMSEINPSELTRTSILSADSDRPQSASDELTPVREVARGQLSADSSPTPIKNSATLQSLGAQHANVSHGDLRALPRHGSMATEEYDSREGMRISAPPVHDSEYDDDEDYDRARMDDYARPAVYDYYNTQDVPPPLKYVPYQPERRGLSPIPSVSGYTEGGSEAPNRDSRLTQSGSPEKSLQREGSTRSRDSVPRSREYGDDDRSVRSSNVDYRNTTYTEDSELDHVTSGRAVRAVGANPNVVHLTSIESNVASLVDGSVLDESVLTAESRLGGRRTISPRQSMATLENERSRDRASQATSSVGSHGDCVAEREHSPVSASQASRDFTEYEPDDYGRKVPVRDRHSPRASEAAITGAAVGAAAAAMRAQQARAQKPLLEAEDEDEEESEDEEEEEESTMHISEGVQRNPSFKERAMKVRGLVAESRHDRSWSEHDEAPRLGFSGVPLAGDALPDGNWRDDDLETNPSLANGNTDPRRDFGEHQADYHGIEVYSQDSDFKVKCGAQGLGAAAMAASHTHGRQEQGDEWYRNSEDRKRDTIVTNPFEGTSPIANLPGLQDMQGTAAYDNNGYDNAYTRSPLGRKVDEGYISQDPHKEPDGRVSGKGKGVDFTGQGGMEDPFFTSNEAHMSGLSHGMNSPLYDATTGAGIDSIESKDIVALMQHLMVRDAQRSARDTEILVTMVRAATEMRNSFDDIKKMLADTEDVIITEVKDNTDRSIQKAINGPRPYPGSGARSVPGSQAGTSTNGDDVPTRKRNIFRRALKGLSVKSPNDLGRIEEMMMQLLTEVDVLKSQTRQGGNVSNHDVQPEVAYEQDHGYEPEGRAGTSTASHASQSGHLSIQSRATSTKPSYDRKVSGHRISTVPEANEDECEQCHGLHADDAVNYNDMLAAPARDQRGSSVPLDTPPHVAGPAQGSLSNENTPRTDESKRRKSGGKTSWFPKISRWSETTTSSVAQAFRRTKKDDDGNSQSVPVHSDSTGNNSDKFPFSSPYADKANVGFSPDKLHVAYSESEQGRPRRHDGRPTMRDVNEAPNYTSMTPEDPKYQAHRNSLNLQHPQPRSGQTERFRAALESQALGFDSPISPKSAEWAGSATSLHRLHRNQNRYSYGSASDAVQQGQYWTTSPGGTGMNVAAAGPPHPPKEPLQHPESPSHSTMGDTPPRTSRNNKLQKKQSPVPYHGAESGDSPTASYSGSKPENRNLSSALGVPTRKPSGPRAMTPRSEEREHERSRKRDTFGSMASQDTDTF